jgi:predicted dehydrogenase
MDAPPLRWGILGTGWIASRFSASLLAHTCQQVHAIGSRNLATAERFASSVGHPAAYGSYEQLVTDPAVDIVYVATPHNHHHTHARLALEAGKHVVVEKPMGLGAAECRDLASLADARGRFLMEAMWTLFLPKYDVIRQLLESGALGTVHSVIADMGEHFDADHRIMLADLAGGPMLDLGTYPVMLATWVLGESPTTATVVGSEATLTIDGPFYQPGGFTLTARDGRSLHFDEPRIGHAGLHWQAAEAARRIAAGELESPLRPVADTILTMEVMDEICRQAGITFAEASRPSA